MRIVDGSVCRRWAIIKIGVVHWDVFTGADWETGLLSWVKSACRRVGDGVDRDTAAVGGRAGGWAAAAALSRLAIIYTMYAYMTSFSINPVVQH